MAAFRPWIWILLLSSVEVLRELASFFFCGVYFFVHVCMCVRVCDCMCVCVVCNWSHANKARLTKSDHSWQKFWDQKARTSRHTNNHLQVPQTATQQHSTTFYGQAATEKRTAKTGVAVATITESCSRNRKTKKQKIAWKKGTETENMWNKWNIPKNVTADLIEKMLAE